MTYTQANALYCIKYTDICVTHRENGRLEDLASENVPGSSNGYLKERGMYFQQMVLSSCQDPVASGCNHHMWPVGVISKWWIDLHTFFSFFPTYCTIFVDYFYSCFVIFLDFSNLIRERIIFECFQHFAA